MDGNHLLFGHGVSSAVCKRLLRVKRRHASTRPLVHKMSLKPMLQSLEDAAELEKPLLVARIADASPNEERAKRGLCDNDQGDIVREFARDCCGSGTSELMSDPTWIGDRTSFAFQTRFALVISSRFRSPISDRRTSIGRICPIFVQVLPFHPTTGWIAISVTRLMRGDTNPPYYGYSWLRSCKPVERAGRSILLYDVPAAGCGTRRIDNCSNGMVGYCSASMMSLRGR
jgi:hypothetical protein